jgi:hypothetical protein
MQHKKSEMFVCFRNGALFRPMLFFSSTVRLGMMRLLFEPSEGKNPARTLAWGDAVFIKVGSEIDDGSPFFKSVAFKDPARGWGFQNDVHPVMSVAWQGRVSVRRNMGAIRIMNDISIRFQQV